MDKRADAEGVPTPAPLGIPTPGERYALALCEKLEKWLVAQAEWPLILGMGRQQRREFARMVADLVTTIPTREPGVWNRAQYRKMERSLRKNIK